MVPPTGGCARFAGLHPGYYISAFQAARSSYRISRTTPAMLVRRYGHSPVQVSKHEIGPTFPPSSTATSHTVEHKHPEGQSP